MAGKVIGIALAALALAFTLQSFPAAAERRNFGPFSVEVPAGWEAGYGHDCLTMFQKEPKSLIMVCSISLDGQAFAEAVREVAEVFGAEPRPDQDGDYVFKFREAEMDLTVSAVVTEEDGHLKMVAMGGDSPQLARILDSLEEKASSGP